MKTCTIPTCDRPVHEKNMCGKHYSRSWSGKPLLDSREVFIRDNPPANGIGKIPLTHGQIAIVDEEDYNTLIVYTWRFTPQDGAVRNLGRKDGVDWKECKKQVYMHRVVLGAGDGEQVDHINHNRLDNRKNNLRTCTAEQNRRNMRKHKGKSKFKGVSWNQRRRKWNGFIQSGYKKIYLGSFDNELACAWFYDTAARMLHREFACTNFPEPSLETLAQAYIIQGKDGKAALDSATEMRAQIIQRAGEIRLGLHDKKEPVKVMPPPAAVAEVNAVFDDAPPPTSQADYQ